MNGPFIPVVMVAIGIMFFAVVFYRANKYVNRFRLRVRYRLSSVQSYFQCYQKSGQCLYFTFAYPRCLLKDDGSEFEAYEKRVTKIVLSSLHMVSLIPSKAICVELQKVDLVRNKYGRIVSENSPLILSFVPTSRICQWKVVSVCDDQVVCEHPIMGQLRLIVGKRLEVGATVLLRQNVCKVDRLYYVDFDLM